MKTYGCTLNQADSDIIRSILSSKDIDITDNEEDSDAVIVNTCTVKEATEQKIINKLQKMDKSGRNIIVTGCMAGANGDIIQKYIPNASIVTTPNIDMMPYAVSQVASKNKVMYNKFGVKDRLNYFKPGEGIISRMPISDGCLSNCAFCETKRARGPLNSFSEDLILKAINLSLKRGSKEIELTSQDVGAYGADKKSSISNLLKKIEGIDGDYKIRIGMLNPEHALKYMDSFIEALNNNHFYKFLHIPVQSGSDKVLKEMNRDYDLQQFYNVVDRLRSDVKGITIETDIIVGYPTETEKDFEDTINLIKDVKPEVSNLSKFAMRPHAPASKLKQLDENEIKRRSVEATRVIKDVQNKINRNYIGSLQDIMLTEKNDISVNGRTDSYKEVVISSPTRELNLGEHVKVKIYGSTANALYANLV
jgi:MiaB-like tRNA modifying enzyme